MYDVVIRNGTLYDGTGEAPRAADVAIEDGWIVAVGKVEGLAREEIDARDKIVAPGFVDIHTHYDGQVTWDPYLRPSTHHGVTTIVMGNCGVGFAPCRREQRDWLIGLLEGVEDIPGTALHAGIQWAWESFPEYLDALERTPLAIDVATQVPHGAVRAYVMGERGVHHDAATPSEITEMAQLVAEAVDAGALGFTTLHAPTVVYDLPASGRRLMQKASGYDLTLVAGKIAFENGEPRPGFNGRLIRGAQTRRRA